MPRCLHIYASGFQCSDESVEATDFCDAHQKVVDFEFERLEHSPLRRIFFRLVALVLLLLFLMPFIYTLRTLYLSSPAKAQEVW
jgi:hypothetical protein